jgi:hypothetical protein
VSKLRDAITAWAWRRGLLLDRLITSDTDRVDRAALALINSAIPAL